MMPTAVDSHVNRAALANAARTQLFASRVVGDEVRDGRAQRDGVVGIDQHAGAAVDDRVGVADDAGRDRRVCRRRRPR